MTSFPGISFTGLTVGPQDVENGVYSNVLFATDTNGNIYALSTSGKLLPIFMNGATSIATGVANTQGLAFSTLDYNLWHISTSDVPPTTIDPSPSQDHGVDPSIDNNINRDPTVPGNIQTNQPTTNANYYFGVDPTNKGGQARTPTMATAIPECSARIKLPAEPTAA